MWRLPVLLYRCRAPKYHANSVVSLQDSLSELNQQLLRHPSILPVDFDISPCGDLVLNVPHTVERYDPGFERDYQNHEFDDQRVPVAKLSHSSSGDTSSPQVNYRHFCDSVYWHFQIHGWKLINGMLLLLYAGAQKFLMLYSVTWCILWYSLWILKNFYRPEGRKFDIQHCVNFTYHMKCWCFKTYSKIWPQKGWVW